MTITIPAHGLLVHEQVGEAERGLRVARLGGPVQLYKH